MSILAYSQSLPRIFRERSSGTAKSEDGFAFHLFIDFLFRGISVLNNKSELQKALEKHRKQSNQKLKETENESCSQFDKILAERAQRLLKVIVQWL